MVTSRALGLALAAALSASALAGCSQGSEKKDPPSAKDAITKSQETVKKYAGLSMKASGKMDSQNVDMSVYGDAKGTTQDLTGKVDGEDVEMITLGNDAYAKAGKKFYQKNSPGMPSSFIDKVADKWVKSTTTSSYKPDLAVPNFIKDYTSSSNDAMKGLLDTKEKVTEEKVGDRDAWKIVSSDKKTTVWVSADDKYDILKAINLKFSGLGDGSQNPTTPVEFLDQGKTHDVSAPQGALDAKKLMAG